MKVSNIDRERFTALDGQFEAVASDFRPDLIGGVRVWTSPDGFVEMNYFSSEEAARAGEQKQAPPELADGWQDFVQMMEGAEFFDLRAPFHHTAT